MLISPAFAQGVGGVFGGMESLLPLVLIFVVFYFLLIRPQQKKQKAHRELLSNLRRGDQIVTSGGLIGKITKINNDGDLTVEIARDVKVRVLRTMVAELLSKPEPVKSRDDDDDDNDDDENEPPKRRRRRKKETEAVEEED